MICAYSFLKRTDMKYNSEKKVAGGIHFFHSTLDKEGSASAQIELLEFFSYQYYEFTRLNITSPP